MGNAQLVRPQPPASPCLFGVIGSRRRNTPADERLLLRHLGCYLRPGDGLLTLGLPCGASWFAERYATAHDTPLTITSDWYDLAMAADFLIAMPAADREGHCEPAISLFQARGAGLYLILV